MYSELWGNSLKTSQRELKFNALLRMALVNLDLGYIALLKFYIQASESCRSREPFSALELVPVVE